MFIGFGDLVKTLKDKAPAITKQPSEAGLIKMELNCITY
jgi:hypothetical protein